MNMRGQNEFYLNGYLSEFSLAIANKLNFYVVLKIVLGIEI